MKSVLFLLLVILVLVIIFIFLSKGLSKIITKNILEKDENLEKFKVLIESTSTFGVFISILLLIITIILTIMFIFIILSELASYSI